MPEQVLDIDDLLRRVIYVHPNYVRPDQTVTSFAFTPRKINGIAEEGLSVDISRFTTYEASIKDRARYRLIRYRRVKSEILVLTAYTILWMATMPTR